MAFMGVRPPMPRPPPDLYRPSLHASTAARTRHASCARRAPSRFPRRLLIVQPDHLRRAQAEGIERTVELLRVADHQDGHPLGLKQAAGGAHEVVTGDRRETVAPGPEIIGGIAVVD